MRVLKRDVVQLRSSTDEIRIEIELDNGGDGTNNKDDNDDSVVVLTICSQGLLPPFPFMYLSQVFNCIKGIVSTVLSEILQLTCTFTL